MTRVLLVSSSWSSAGYGGQRSAQLLRHGLEAAGARVTVAAPQVGGSAAGDDVLHLEHPTRDLHRHLRGGNVDVVHLYNPEALASTVTAARLAGVPAVVTVNSYWPTCLWADMLFPDGEICRGCSLEGIRRDYATRDPDTVGSRVPAALARMEVARRTLLLNRFHRIVVLSDASRQRLLDGGVRGERIVQVPNMADPEDLREAIPTDLPPEPRVLFVGQLKHVKGVDHLLRSFVHVLREVPDAELTLVGDGPQREDLQALARDLGVDEAVSFRGYVEREALRDLYRDHRVLAHPSLWSEPFSRVLLEAWSHGLPVVSTPRGASAEVIDDGANGLLGSATDPGGFGSALARALTEPELADELREAGRASAEALQPTRVGARYLDVYDEATGA